MTRMILAVVLVVGAALPVGAALCIVLSAAVVDYLQSGSQTTATDQTSTTPAYHPAREKPSAGKPKAQKAMSYASLHAKDLVSVNSESIH
jgi:hypothetical protein